MPVDSDNNLPTTGNCCIFVHSSHAIVDVVTWSRFYVSLFWETTTFCKSRIAIIVRKFLLIDVAIGGYNLHYWFCYFFDRYSHQTAENQVYLRLAKTCKNMFLGQYLYFCNLNHSFWYFDWADGAQS